MRKKTSLDITSINDKILQFAVGGSEGGNRLQKLLISHIHFIFQTKLNYLCLKKVKRFRTACACDADLRKSLPGEGYRWGKHSRPLRKKMHEEIPRSLEVFSAGDRAFAHSLFSLSKTIQSKSHLHPPITIHHLNRLAQSKNHVVGPRNR